MVMTRSATTIRPFVPADIPAAADLLAERHRRHRAAEPALDPAYEQSSATRAQLETLVANETAGGWAAVRDESLIGYLIGVGKDPAIWGANVWIEAPGHAAAEPEVIRDLYAVAAQHWVDAGRPNHHALVPATDVELVNAWFSLDFGQQHLHAVREVPGPSFALTPRSELIIRPATREDVRPLIELGRVLPLHLANSPVFSRLPVESDEAMEVELRADLVDPTYQFYVAEHEGRVIGVSLACSLEVSPGTTGLNRPDRAGYLAHAAVLPEARGLGAGRALGDAVLAWSRDRGYRSVATDWRSTNVEADRAWRAIGFRPTFRRLHRLIG